MKQKPLALMQLRFGPLPPDEELPGGVYIIDEYIFNLEIERVLKVPLGTPSLLLSRSDALLGLSAL